jgi:acetyl-CoA C-acetyltransferase
MMAVNQIQLGEADIMVAGGMESMSNTPYYLKKHRFGSKLGHQKVEDGILSDGLWDVYNDYHMGSAAELCARECQISREAQDEFTSESYKRAIKANREGWFSEEIVPMKVKDHSGKVEKIVQDEEPGRVDFDRIPELSPVFEQNGTVTAANASTINDGAAGVILMSGDEAQKQNIEPIARIVSHASTAKAPEWFTTAPSEAIPLALKRSGWNKQEVDLWEINEAFAVVTVANNRILELDPAKVNIHGGAVSLGHPIGCSGARIIVTLAHALKQHDLSKGCAGICNGGGGASAMTIEMM